MTGQDFQDRLDALVRDLQTKGEGQTVQIAFRGSDNDIFLKPLSSDVNGVVDAAQLASVQATVNGMRNFADAFATESVAVSAASEAFNTARAVHQPLIDAAQAANAALRDALAADAGYQAAKTALDAARADAAYVAARNDYETENVSENYAALAQAKGEYLV